jgi:hypothetical protein
MTTAKILLTLSNLPIVVTALYVSVVFKQLNKELIRLSYYIFFSLVIQIVSFSLSLLHINNMLFLHLNVYVCVGLLGWFYAEVFNGFINRRIIATVVVLFWLGCIIDIIINNPFQRFNSMLLTVQCVLMITISLFTFSFMLNGNIRILKKHLFDSLMWINSGIFIYFTSNILLFFFNNAITAMAVGTKMGSKMWVFHAFFIMVMYCCFFIGIWKRQRA